MRRQRGATLVEAALILPVLFALVFGILEFGRILNMYQAMTDAAREGARFGSAPCQSGDTGQTTCTYGGAVYQAGELPSATSIRAYAQKFLDANAVKGYTIDVAWDRDDFNLTANTNPVHIHYRHVAVDVSANYQWVYFPFPGLPLHTRAVMKHELDLD
jgi:Flp pilus assembly protein TadG